MFNLMGSSYHLWSPLAHNGTLIRNASQRPSSTLMGATRIDFYIYPNPFWSLYKIFIATIGMISYSKKLSPVLLFWFEFQNICTYIPHLEGHWSTPFRSNHYWEIIKLLCGCAQPHHTAIAVWFLITHVTISSTALDNFGHVRSNLWSSNSNKNILNHVFKHFWLIESVISHNFTKASMLKVCTN
jgi:hypothetical protein